MGEDLLAYYRGREARAALAGFFLGLNVAKVTTRPDSPDPVDILAEIAADDLTLVETPTDLIGRADEVARRLYAAEGYAPLRKSEKATAIAILEGVRGSSEAMGRKAEAGPSWLEEAALRRPDFMGGKPVVMHGGNAWFLPTGMAPELEPLFDALDLAEAAEADGSIDPEAPGTFQVMVAIAANMLLKNYYLDVPSISALLSWPPGQRDACERLGEILCLAGGTTRDWT